MRIGRRRGQPEQLVGRAPVDTLQSGPVGGVAARAPCSAPASATPTSSPTDVGGT